MSPISAEMNGANLKEMGGGRGGSKSLLSDDSTTSLDISDERGGSAGGEDSGPNSGRVLSTSTPIQDVSIDENESELPTSSTGSHYGGSSSAGVNGAPKYGTMIPNRVFVGGISPQTTEHELVTLFSQFGSVRGAKIIMDRGGISKGYGFITFETEEEAKRLYNPGPNREIGPIYHRDRRLNIAPAVKKQVLQPMMRPGIVPYSDGLSPGPPPPYSASGVNGGGSSAASQAQAAQAAAAAAAAAASFFYTQGTGHGGGHHNQPFYCAPGASTADTYFGQAGQTAGNTSQSGSAGGYHHHQNSALHAAQFFSPNGPAGAGGTIYFVQHPNLPPYQQALQDTWGAASTLNGGGGSALPWRFMSPGSLQPPNPFGGPMASGLGGSGGAGTQSMASSPPQGHGFLQDYLGHASGTFGPSDLLFFNPTVISSPH